MSETTETDPTTEQDEPSFDGRGQPEAPYTQELFLDTDPDPEKDPDADVEKKTDAENETAQDLNHSPLLAELYGGEEHEWTPLSSTSEGTARLHEDGKYYFPTDLQKEYPLEKSPGETESVSVDGKILAIAYEAGPGDTVRAFFYERAVSEFLEKTDAKKDPDTLAQAILEESALPQAVSGTTKEFVETKTAINLMANFSELQNFAAVVLSGQEEQPTVSEILNLLPAQKNAAQTKTAPPSGTTPVVGRETSGAHYEKIQIIQPKPFSEQNIRTDGVEVSDRPITHKILPDNKEGTVPELKAPLNTFSEETVIIPAGAQYPNRPAQAKEPFHDKQEPVPHQGEGSGLEIPFSKTVFETQTVPGRQMVLENSGRGSVGPEPEPGMPTPNQEKHAPHSNFESPNFPSHEVIIPLLDKSPTLTDEISHIEPVLSSAAKTEPIQIITQTTSQAAIWGNMPPIISPETQPGAPIAQIPEKTSFDPTRPGRLPDALYNIPSLGNPTGPQQSQQYREMDPAAQMGPDIINPVPPADRMTIPETGFAPNQQQPQPSTPEGTPYVPIEGLQATKNAPETSLASPAPLKQPEQQPAPPAFHPVINPEIPANDPRAGEKNTVLEKGTMSLPIEPKAVMARQTHTIQSALKNLIHPENRPSMPEPRPVTPNLKAMQRQNLSPILRPSGQAEPPTPKIQHLRHEYPLLGMGTKHGVQAPLQEPRNNTVLQATNAHHSAAAENILRTIGFMERLRKNRGTSASTTSDQNTAAPSANKTITLAT